MWLLVSIITILMVIGLYLYGKYNHLTKLSRLCDEAMSTLDIFLKRRFDLIVKVCELLKAYAPRYDELSQKLSDNREEGLNTFTLTEKAQANENLKLAVREFISAGDENPELHSNPLYLEFQGDLRALELDIANAVDLFNDHIKDYNHICRIFPGNIVSSLFKLPLKKKLEIEVKKKKIEEPLN